MRPHSQSDSNYRTGFPGVPLTGADWKDPDNKEPSVNAGSEGRVEFWAPLGCLVVSLLTEESLRLGALLGPLQIKLNSFENFWAKSGLSNCSFPVRLPS